MRFAANNQQIDKAKAIVKAINFKYSPEDFDNPSLQKHFANIEAMALDRDAPEEVDDLTSELDVFLLNHGVAAGPLSVESVGEA